MVYKDKIKYAAFAGVLYMVIPLVFGMFIGFQRSIFGNYSNYTLLRNFILYFLSSSLSIICIYGFVLIGRKYKVSFLRLTSYSVIVSDIISSIYFFLISISPSLNIIRIELLVNYTFWIALILFGFAIQKLRPNFGSVATWISNVIIIIATGACFRVLPLLGILIFPIGSVILFNEINKKEII